MNSRRGTAASVRPVARTLYDIAQILESAEGSEQRVRRVLDLLRRIVAYDQCTLLEVQPNRELRLLPVPEPSPEEREVLRQVLTHHLHLLAGPAEPPPLEHRRAVDGLGHLGSHLAVPLVGLDEVVGLLFVGRGGDQPYVEQDLSLLSVVAAQLAAYLTALALRQQETERAHELETVINTMVDGLAILDSQRTIRHTNPAWLRLFGLVGQTAIPGSLDEYASTFELRRGDEQPLAWQDSPFVLPLNGIMVLGEEVLLGRPDGSIATLRVSGAPVLDEHGQVRLAVLTCHDVTEARALQRLRDEFIATYSHDLKNPLTVIKGYVNLAQRRPELDIRRPLNMILEQAEVMRRLIDQLLDASRLQAGRFQLSPQSAELVELVQQQVAEMQAATEKHHFELQAPEGLVYGCWERDRIGQALRNLLSNAVKFSPAGGQVLVRVAPEDGRVRVEVIDQGIGIPPEQLPLLFGRFARGAFAARAGIPGTGLGLFITKGIVEAHGGEIWAHSEGPGRGATFAFRLPLQAPGCRG